MNIRIPFGAITLWFLGLSSGLWAQLEIAPDPTSVNELMTLTIDVSQSNEHGLKTILQNNPDLPVYIWTWSPSAPIGGNGEWLESNEDMKLTYEGNLKYSITFKPSEWYEDVTNFYANGISCLAKLKNGSAFAGYEEFGEAKTEDFNIKPNAPVCDELICEYPTYWKTDDYVTFRFFPFNDKDSTLFAIDQATGIDTLWIHEYNGPAQLQIVARATDGQFYPDEMNLETTRVDMFPMEDYPRAHQYTIYPPDFLAGILPEGESLYSLTVYPVIEGYDYPTSTQPGAPEQEFTFRPDCDE